MQQFTVPQFIDVEDKIIGPLSVRQFVILLVTAGVTAIWYRLFDFTLFVVSGILTIIVGGLFAFAKIRGMTLHYFLLCFFQTLSRPGLRVWNKWLPFEMDDVTIDDFKRHDKQAPVSRRFSTSHLNKLSLIVDTRGYYSGDEQDVNVYKQAENLDDMRIG